MKNITIKHEKKIFKTLNYIKSMVIKWFGKNIRKNKRRTISSMNEPSKDFVEELYGPIHENRLNNLFEELGINKEKIWKSRRFNL